MDRIIIFTLTVQLLLSELPICISQDDNIVQGSEILTKIEKCKSIECNHCVIKGDLNLSELVPSNQNSPEEIKLDTSKNKKVINSTIKINNSIIEEDVDFNGAIFLKPVYFQNTIFLNNVNLKDSEFNNSADFSRSSFAGDADFTSVKFYKIANFRFLKFQDDVQFIKTYFAEDAKFSGSRFKGYADFENSIFKKNAYFDRCYFTDAFMDDAIFEETLFLNKSGYNRLYIEWNMIKFLFYDETTYYLLIENFKKLGRLIDADNCFLESKILSLKKEKEEYYKNTPESIQHISHLYELEMKTIFLYFTGYNKRPWAMFWSMVFVVFWGFYWGPVLRKSSRFVDEYSREWDEKTNLRSDRMLISGMIFSFNLFFSGSTLNILKPPPPPDLPVGSNTWARQMYLLERLYGTLLTIFVSIYLTKILSEI